MCVCVTGSAVFVGTLSLSVEDTVSDRDIFQVPAEWYGSKLEKGSD